MFDIKKLCGKVVVVVGHFGCGKTNISANLAKMLSEYGKTYLIDYDNVNPYFRSADVKAEFSGYGINVITSEFANTNVDIPSVSPLVFSALSDECANVVLDVGGDMLGAVSVGYLNQKLKSSDVTVLYVFSAYRPLSDTPEKAYVILKEIEEACGLQVNALVNNSNTGDETTAEDVENTAEYAEKLSLMSSLPLLFTSYMTDEKPKVKGEVLKIKNYTKKLF